MTCHEKLDGNICAARVRKVDSFGMKCARRTPLAASDPNRRRSMNSMTPVWLSTVETANPSKPIPRHSPGSP